MPIISLKGAEAVRLRKANQYATWGSRNEDNRVEPVADPAFEVPFHLKKGEPIFTIGSCFARNVEGELLNRGFRIPVRELFKKPAFEGLSPEIINNFGTPSIYNELAWAFGEEQYDEDVNIVEVGKDKFVDLHMINSIRPCPLKTVLERRRGVLKATRTLKNCRVLIMTLGLVELWWDEQSQCYLNTAPLPMVLKKWPDRFSLHILSFAECYDYLRRALDIVFKNGRRGLSVILTVSPVPMMATHRNVDVITANTYSKSVLRAVAEQLVAENEKIIYFPSYETVSLSDRRLSWSDDFVHVNKQMIALNVERMVNAFTQKTGQVSPILEKFDAQDGETAEALLLSEQARIARLSGNAEFFEEYADAASTSPTFAVEYTKFLFDSQHYDKVLEATENSDSVEMVGLRAKALIVTGKPKEARDLIRAVCLEDFKGAGHWRTYIEAAAAMKSKSAIIQAEAEWLKTQPRSKGLIQAVVGRALRVLGEEELAVERLLKAAALPDRADATVIQCAASLVALKRYKKAAQVIEGVVGNSDWQIHQISQLKNKINRYHKKTS